MLMMLHKPRRTPGEQIVAAIAEGANRLAGALDAALAAPFHWAETRRSMAVLASMDDHALQDIGLTRLDIADAWSLPVAKDPTSLLAARRAERRRAH